MKAKKQSQKRKDELKQKIEQELVELERRVVEEAPARGYTPTLQEMRAFRTLPISDFTLRGLEDSKPPFTTMTDIQNACIPHALAGRDILGAARTGSGKTLSFLIPLLETLYRNQFTPEDGPGAVCLAPTRELAVQIFQVLRLAGKYHAFSVGLLIGGKKDFFEEQKLVATTNIIIATPGRILQHLESTPYFDLSQMKILVLDEADRILDMGFRDQLVKILDYMPTERQTLLFSATQTRDVSHLATLSLTRPEYLGVHDKEKISTPEALQQSYVVVPLEHKLDAVYSFVKSHLKTKSIVFLATCAQVRHAWELFCSLRPGVPIMALHGKLVQEKRTQIYFDFLHKPHAVLFATDIAARGLDFKGVDWVVQVDAPEDREMYIHRVGRTARFRAGGKALLMVTPSEEEKDFCTLVQGKGASTIPIKKLSINPTKTVVVQERAASLIASNTKLHDLAKKAFHSYVRSIHLMPRKEIFDTNDLDVDGYAKALGLATTPNLRFLKKAPQDREELRESKNVNRKLQRLKEQIKAEKLAKKLKKMGKSDKDIQETIAKNGTNEEHDSSDDELLVSKGVINVVGDDEDLPDAGIDRVSKSRNPKRIRIEGSNIENKRIVFNDDGEVEDDLLEDNRDVDASIAKDKDDLARATDSYMSKIRDRLAQNFEKDNEEAKDRVRQKHKKRRLRDKEERDADGSAPVAVLGSGKGDSSASSSRSSETSSQDSSSDDESVSSTENVSLADVKAQEDAALSLIRGS